jgi:hypothetical protein
LRNCGAARWHGVEDLIMGAVQIFARDLPDKRSLPALRSTSGASRLAAVINGNGRGKKLGGNI